MQLSPSRHGLFGLWGLDLGLGVRVRAAYVGLEAADTGADSRIDTRTCMGAAGMGAAGMGAGAAGMGAGAAGMGAGAAGLEA